MGKITIRDLKIYAYHGCFSEEKKIGSKYKLDVWVEGDFSEAEKSDQLSNTVDYVAISDIANEEMAISSNLIENVANRILDRVLLSFNKITCAGVTIKKKSPPMNQDVYAVEYELEKRPN
mgnify:FL=1